MITHALRVSGAFGNVYFIELGSILSSYPPILAFGRVSIGEVWIASSRARAPASGCHVW